MRVYSHLAVSISSLNAGKWKSILMDYNQTGKVSLAHYLNAIEVEDGQLVHFCITFT